MDVIIRGIAENAKQSLRFLVNAKYVTRKKILPGAVVNVMNVMIAVILVQ